MLDRPVLFSYYKTRMKKELGIAIFIGILLGFGLSAFFWAKNIQPGVFDLASNETVEEITEEIEIEVTPAEENIEEDIFLNIFQPENEIVSDSQNLKISGETFANAVIVIFWDNGADILVADKEGKFENQIELTAGENTINVSAYDDQGNKSAQTLTVTYSTAKF